MKQPRFTEQAFDFLLRHAAVVPDNDAGVEAPVDVDVPTQDRAEDHRDNGSGPAILANGATTLAPVDTAAPLDAPTKIEEHELVAEEIFAPDEPAFPLADASQLEVTSAPAQVQPQTVDVPVVEEAAVPVEASTPAEASAPVEVSAPADGAALTVEASKPEQPPSQTEVSASAIDKPDAKRAAAEISPNTFDVFRNKYAGLSLEDMTRLQKLEDENSRLRELIARLIVERQPSPDSDEEASEPAMPSFMAKPSGPTFTSSELAPYEPDVSARAAMTLAAEDARSDTIETARQSARDAAAMIGESWTHARAAAVRLGVRALDLRPAAVAPALRQAAGRAAVRLKSAVRNAPNLRTLSWGEARRIAAVAAKDARRKSKGREILLAGIAGGLLAGFAVGIKSSPLDESEPVMLPVDMSVRLNSYSSGSAILEKGWDKPQAWGTWISGTPATVLIGFDGPSRGDVELLIEGRTQPVQGVDPPTITVRFNDAELGRWRMPAQAGELRRRFIVPAAIFNKNTEARVSFELPAAPAPSVFGVKALSVRDVRFLADFKGFVDTCSSDKIAGWAIADGAPVSVAASVDGKPIAVEWTNLDREDLAAQKLPADAGFVLKPETAIASGSKVEVRFANGRPLIGSPCKP